MTYVPHEDPIHCALCVLEHLSAGAKDYPYAEKWRRLCALVKP